MIEWNHSTICLTGIESTPRIRPARQPQWSLRATIQQLPVDVRWALRDIAASDNGVVIAQALRDGTAVAVSDGSFKDKFGTAAWVIEGRRSDGWVEGQCIIPGGPEDQSAYRSELGGLYAIAAMVQVICELHNIQEGSIEVACDGMNALAQVGEADPIIRPNGAQYDIIAATQAKIKRTNIQWKMRHVMGHQDDTQGCTVMDRWETLNCMMDERAKQHWQHHSTRTTRVQEAVDGEPWAVWTGSSKICGRLAAPGFAQQVR